MNGSNRALIVGCTLVCRIPHCCVLAAVSDDAVDAAADVVRDDVLLLVPKLWVLVAATTVATGTVVGAAKAVCRRQVEVLATDDAAAISVCVIHCDGNVADIIGDCLMMGRMSSSKLDCGKLIYPPGSPRNLSGSIVCKKYSRPSSMMAHAICRQRLSVKLAQHLVTRSLSKHVYILCSFHKYLH